ncbi:MAG: hypothetical protein LRY71_16600 [Bacillaceae bacterium]|nr:hypothetical protein [Bacillaceae bacterium]
MSSFRRDDLTSAEKNTLSRNTNNEFSYMTHLNPNIDNFFFVNIQGEIYGRNGSSNFSFETFEALSILEHLEKSNFLWLSDFNNDQEHIYVFHGIKNNSKEW